MYGLHLINKAAEGLSLLNAHFQDLAADLLEVVRSQLVQLAHESLLLRLLNRVICAGLADLHGQAHGLCQSLRHDANQYTSEW